MTIKFFWCSICPYCGSVEHSNCGRGTVHIEWCCEACHKKWSLIREQISSDMSNYAKGVAGGEHLEVGKLTKKPFHLRLFHKVL